MRAGRSAPNAIHDVQALIDARPRVVLQCGGHAAVKEFAAPLPKIGIDVIVSSIGALGDDGVRAELLEAEQSGARALLPAGVIGDSTGCSPHGLPD